MNNGNETESNGNENNGNGSIEKKEERETENGMEKRRTFYNHDPFLPKEQISST